jgi:hypothetical protein
MAALDFPASPTIGQSYGNYTWDGTAWTPLMQAQAAPTSDFRNKIINGDFQFWQYATSQTISGFGSDDRWANQNVGSTKTHSLINFALGQTSVPGNPFYFSRTVVTSVAGANNYCFKSQRIESVQTLSGRLATVSFWAKADAPKNIAVEFYQTFGTGGSPSASVTGIGVTTCALTTVWQKFSFTVQIPSIAGMVFGANNDHYLGFNFWFDAGSTSNPRTNNLGQQSGTFDISHVSLVDGDATQEADPFSPRHQQQELALCQRYYFRGQGTVYNSGYSPNAAGLNVFAQRWFPVQMRATPVQAGATFGSNVNMQTVSVQSIDTQHVTWMGLNNAVGLYQIGVSSDAYSAEL